MRVVIAGGHGKIALRLARLLVDRGDEAVGLVRNPDHIADLRAAGAEGVECDLERATVGDVEKLLAGADAAVFAAGAGPGSGVARKESVDKGAAILLADAVQAARVPRLLQISAMGAGKPPAPERGDVWAAYIAAKTLAEGDLRRRDVGWTIVRPGRLTDDSGTGHVTLAPPPMDRGEVPRDDVAATIAELLGRGVGIGLTVELVGGDVPITEAVENLPTR